MLVKRRALNSARSAQVFNGRYDMGEPRKDLGENDLQQGMEETLGGDPVVNVIVSVAG